MHWFILFCLIMLQMTFGEQNTEKESHEMLSYAVEHGINCIDTAEAVSFFIFYLVDLCTGQAQQC